MDGMGCASAVDRPSPGLGNEETGPVNLTPPRDRKPIEAYPAHAAISERTAGPAGVIDRAASEPRRSLAHKMQLRTRRAALHGHRPGGNDGPPAPRIG